VSNLTHCDRCENWDVCEKFYQKRDRERAFDWERGKIYNFRMWRKNIEGLIEAALEEDMPRGDITSDNIIPEDSVSRALIMAKEDGILAGIFVAERVFKKIDPQVIFEIHRKDGQRIGKGDKLAVLTGHSRSLLKGERTALNFLQRMSGIATTTDRYVRALEGKKTNVLDTRKTTPGLRSLEKYAVKMGGGMNHRLSLSDMVMIKDNHLKIVGSITKAVEMARQKVNPGIKIEVETTSLDEVREALGAGADIVMLDNMSWEEMREVMDWIKGRVTVEVSGNIDERKIGRIAELGVDFVSIGALTHSYSSLDISMEFLD
jgi:nicotinate-nucleotide pyrophosphorylase (carboxylating)